MRRREVHARDISRMSISKYFLPDMGLEQHSVIFRLVSNSIDSVMLQSFSNSRIPSSNDTLILTFFLFKLYITPTVIPNVT